LIFENNREGREPAGFLKPEARLGRRAGGGRLAGQSEKQKYSKKTTRIVKTKERAL
jgi:hypothetical protein